MSSLGDLHDDDNLMAALADAFDAGDMPPDVTQFARDAWQWIAIDGELARLTSDMGADQLAGTRASVTDERYLTFEAPNGTIELQLGPGRVVGQIEPEGSYELTLTTSAGQRQIVNSDETGRFRAQISAPFRVTVRSEGLILTTEWITA